MAPKDGVELRAMLELALTHSRPSAIRFPRGKIHSPAINHPESVKKSPVTFSIGESDVLKDGEDIAILAIGTTVSLSLSAAERLENEGVSAMVVNARFVKPLDRNLLSSVTSKLKKIITVEENALEGGFGSAVIELLNDMEIHDVRVRRLGIPDEFIEIGQQSELRKKYSLDEEGIYLAVLSFLKEPTYIH